MIFGFKNVSGFTLYLTSYLGENNLKLQIKYTVVPFANGLYSEEFIFFTTSLSVLTMCMSANTTDKGPSIAQPSFYL